jgi:hypothetical protein
MEEDVEDGTVLDHVMLLMDATMGTVDFTVAGMDGVQDCM